MAQTTHVPANASIAALPSLHIAPQGFNVTYDARTGRVSVDRAIVRGRYQVTLQTG